MDFLWQLKGESMEQTMDVATDERSSPVPVRPVAKHAPADDAAAELGLEAIRRERNRRAAKRRLRDSAFEGAIAAGTGQE
ncbi:MAG: hypothetical protein ACRC33_02000 [Gemmataceae bacterium]